MGGRPLKFSTTLPTGGGHDHLIRESIPLPPGFWEVMDLLPYKWAVMRMNVRTYGRVLGWIEWMLTYMQCNSISPSHAYMGGINRRAYHKIISQAVLFKTFTCDYYIYTNAILFQDIISINKAFRCVRECVDRQTYISIWSCMASVLLMSSLTPR
jgi:hypothetical protein